MTKKKVFVAAIAICLVAILSFGTLAWFNATDDITNTFRVTTDADNTDPEFSVTVTETDLDGEETEDGVEYYNVLPGDAIAKDPTITNTGDYDQWIRVAVTLTDAGKWYSGGGSLTFTDLFEGENITYGLTTDVGTDGITWLLVQNPAIIDGDGNAVWYLYLNSELAAGDSALLFDTVNIPENFDFDDAMALGDGKGEFNITVKADAVQSANTGDNAVEAFAKVNWAPGTAFVDIDY